MAKFDDHKHHRRSIRLNGYDYTRPGAYFVTLVTWQRECLFGEVGSGEMYPNPYGRLAENEWRRLGERFKRIGVDEWIVMPNHVHGILVIVENDLDGMGTGIVARQEDSTDAVVGARQEDSTEPVVGARQEDSIDIVVGAGQGNSSPFGGRSFAPPLHVNSHHPLTSHNVPGGASGVIPGSLGSIVGAYKSTTARLINSLRRIPGAPVWQRNFYEHIIRDEDELQAIRAYIHNNPFEWELDPDNPNRTKAEE